MSNTKFAKGKHALFICDRCGMSYPYLKQVIEPGTNLAVCSECNDGRWNRVGHPQNKPPRDLVDGVALRNPRPDRQEPGSDNSITDDDDQIFDDTQTITD